MSTPGTITLREVVSGGDNPAYQVSQDEWNDSLVVDGGSDGDIMVRDSLNPDGWGFVPFSTVSPITTQGDLIVGDASGLEVRLPVGAANTILYSNGTVTAWSATPKIGTSLHVGVTAALGGAGVLALPNGSDNGIAFLNAAGTNYHLRLQMTAAGHFWARSMATGVTILSSFLAFNDGATTAEPALNATGLTLQVKRGDNSFGATNFQVGDSSAVGGQGSFGIGIQSGNPYAHLAVGSGDVLLPNVSKGAGATVYGGLFQVAMKMTGASASHYGLGVFPTSLADGSARTVTQQVGIIVIAGQKDANTTVTTAYGIRVQAPTVGATNYPLYIEGGNSYLGDTVALGSPASATGTIRASHGFTLIGRNAANGADISVLDWGALSNNRLTIGDAANAVTVITGASVTVNAQVGGSITYGARAMVWTQTSNTVQFSDPGLTKGVVFNFNTDAVLQMHDRANADTVVLKTFALDIPNLGYAEFGNSPAQSGYVRFNYGGVHIVARRNDNAADMEVLKVATVNASTNIAILGRETAAVQLSSGNCLIGIGSFNDANFPALQRSSSELQIVDSRGGSNYTNLRASTLIAENNITGVAVGSALVLGSAPSTTGSGRFSNNTTVTWRNAANSANLNGLVIDGGNDVLVGPNAAGSDVYLRGEYNFIENGFLGFGASFSSSNVALRRSGTILLVKLGDDTGYGTLDAGAFKVGGVAGVDFGPAPVASITVVKGIVTAIS